MGASAANVPAHQGQGKQQRGGGARKKRK